MYWGLGLAVGCCWTQHDACRWVLGLEPVCGAGFRVMRSKGRGLGLAVMWYWWTQQCTQLGCLGLSEALNTSQPAVLADR